MGAEASPGGPGVVMVLSVNCFRFSVLDIVAARVRLTFSGATDGSVWEEVLGNE
jgi:hypothetical protein